MVGQHGPESTLQINIKRGSVITGANPNNPLILDTRNGYITGLFDFNLNFSTLSNSSNDLLKLHDGVAKMKVEVANAETIKARDIYLKGVSSITAQNTSINCSLELLNGTLTSVKGQQPEFNSKIKFTLEQSNAIDIVTPYYKPDDDTRVFPLKLSISLISPVQSQEGNVSFKGQSIDMDELVMSPKFGLTIFGGAGEHKNPDDPNSANGQEGPDKFHGWQEAVFYDCPSPLGVRHFYLVPQPYAITSTMKISISDKIISFNFGSLSIDTPIAWDKDGCDLDKWLGVFGAVFGSLFLGPVGTVVGGIVGVVAGDKIEDNLAGIINAGIARKTTEFNFNKQWAFK